MKTRLLKRLAFGLVVGLTGVSWATAQESAATADLPSAESILDRYVEVTGGADVYEAIRSSVARGTMAIQAAGIVGQIEVHTRPGLQSTKVELPNVGVIQAGVKDGVAWESSVITGPRILQGTEADITLLGATPNAPLLWRELYQKVETVGIEDVRGEPAYRVAQTVNDEFTATAFYSVESGLLVKTQMMVDTAFGTIPIEQLVDEYSEIDGLMSPSKLSISQAGAMVVMTFTSGELNVEIPDEQFDFPDEIKALLP
jgi:hypothetical protein